MWVFGDKRNIVVIESRGLSVKGKGHIRKTKYNLLVLFWG